MTDSSELGYGPAGGKSASPTLLLVQITVISVKLCLSLNDVNCSCGMRLSFNHSMYFMLPKTICILLKTNFHASLGLLYTFSAGILLFLGIKLKFYAEWILMFVAVLLVLINHENRDCVCVCLCPMLSSFMIEITQTTDFLHSNHNHTQIMHMKQKTVSLKQNNNDGGMSAHYYPYTNHGCRFNPRV
jgi:hypothetical protein